MPNKNDYSQVLDNVPTPTPVVQSPETGRALGDAARIAGQANANLFTFLGTVATEGAKGVMQGQAEDEINAVLSKLDTVAERDIDANNRKLAGGLMQASSSDDYMGGQTVAAFTEEAQRFAEARRQGVIGRDEALTQIGTVIKKYSAMAPGFASDFRKVGAELTGISNVDVYGIHHDLTTQSAREKLALQQAEADAQLKKEAASALGLSSITQLTPDSLAFYRSVKQSNLAIQRMEDIKKGGTIEQEQRDKVNVQLANNYITNTVSGVASKFAQLHAAHMTADSPDKQAAALKLGGEVAAELDVAQAQLVAKIKSMSYGQNPMDPDKNRKLVDEVEGIFKTYKEVVKTAEGFNTWTQVVKAAKGNAEYVVNAFKVLHPHAAVLAEFGVMSKFAEAMVALGGDEAEFKRRFGKPAFEAASAVLNGSNMAYAQTMGAVASGKASLDDVAKVNPGIAKVAYNDIIQIIEDQSKQGGVLRNEQKLSMSNLVHQWLGMMNHTDAANLKKFKEIAGDPNGKFWTQMLQLEPEQRKHALLPLFDKVVYTAPNMLKDLKQQVESYNKLEVNEKIGHKADIKFDPITSMFSVQIKEGKNNAIALTEDKSHARYTNPTALAGFGISPRGTSAQREALDVMQQRVNWLNTIPEVMAKALPMANDNFNGIKPSELATSLYESYKSGEGGVGKALVERMNVNLVPGNTPTTPAPKRSLSAAASSVDSSPPTPDEARQMHTKNIELIQGELKIVKHPKAKAVLESELETEQAALAALQ